MFSVLCIFTSRGEILLSEIYRKDVPHEDLENFISLILKSKPGLLPPQIHLGDSYGFYIRRDNLIYLLISKVEQSSLIPIQFLDRFHGVIRDFCGSSSEDAIRKNLVLVHELMTECIECGYIQTTNTEKLRPMVYSDPVSTKTGGRSEGRRRGAFGQERVIVPGSAADRPLVRSRSQQNFKQNEVFVDVIEKLTVHTGKDGMVQMFYLNGSIQLKSFVSMSHSVTISLNDDLNLGQKQAYVSGIHLDHHFFHDCVDAKNFKKAHSFVVRPPQGEISVMEYRTESLVPAQLPFRLVSATEEYPPSKDIDLTLKLCCNVPSNAEVLNLVIHTPVSSATKSIMQQFNIPDSTAEFIKKERKILWKIKSLPGKSEAIAKFKLIDALHCAANRLELGPIALEFEVSNFVCSGLTIKSLKAEDPASVPIPIQRWVRYVSLADSYVFKLQQFLTR